MKKSVIGSFLALSLVLLFAVPAMAADINLSVAASLREVVTELSDTFAKTMAASGSGTISAPPGCSPNRSRAVRRPTSSFRPTWSGWTI